MVDSQNSRVDDVVIKIREWYKLFFAGVLLISISTFVSVIFGILNKSYIDFLYMWCISGLPATFGMYIAMLVQCFTNTYFFSKSEIIFKKRKKVKKIMSEQIISLEYLSGFYILLFQVEAASLIIKYIPKTGEEPSTIKYDNYNVFCVPMAKRSARKIASKLGMVLIDK